jgi:hypothetical protein
MDARDLVLPAAVLVGGALLGRIFGFKPIWRGAMAALALAQASKGAGLIESGPVAHRKRAPRHKTTSRAVRKKTAQKKSPKVAHATKVTHATGS